MGGDAYVIPGTLSPERLAASTSTRPSVLQRLLGRDAAQSGVTVTTSAAGDTMYEIPPGSLPKHLVHDFREWLRSRLSAPSEGTQVPLQYVLEIEPSVYVRGVQHAGEDAPHYAVQMSFSGCAGEAETSARVASHWAGLWYRAEQQRIANAYLRPFGFDPSPIDSAEKDWHVFLPAGDLGYLELVSPEDSGSDAPTFELDYATVEALEGDPRLERLHELFGHYVRSGACRCQLCEPDFGDARTGEGT